MDVFATINFGDEDETDKDFEGVVSLDTLVEQIKTAYDNVSSVVLVFSC